MARQAAPGTVREPAGEAPACVRRPDVPRLDRVFKAAYAAKPTLLFDIDGVLAFLAHTILTAVNARFGTSYAIDDMRRYWVESWLPPEQGDWLADRFDEPDFYATVAPDYRAVDALLQLYARVFRVVIATDRPASAADVTRAWLARYGVSFDELVVDGPGSKATVAARHDEDDPLIVFDDDPRKWLELPRPGVEVWSPRRVWTPNEAGLFNVTVFDSWPAVVRRLTQ